MKLEEVLPALSEKSVALSNKMRQILASLKLEGIDFPPESLADINLLDSGKMSKEEFIKKTITIAKS